MRPLSRTDPAHIASYRLLGVLGEGGMGRVYLGQSRSGRKIAIKVLSPRIAEDPEYRHRFAREVAAARSVNPLFTAAVVDAGADDQVPWLATTFINGPSLQEWVRSQGPLPEQTVLTLAAGLAEALASIHSAKLVHRDLKPSNVLIDQDGPHVIDFGIALDTLAARITTSILVGTPSYMAPERVHGADADPAGDMFSLGATLYFACTGEELVSQGSFYEQISQVALGRFDLSKVPNVCRSIIVRCLSPQAADRPTAEELSRILAGIGVLAPGPGWADATGGAPPEKVTELPPVPVSRRKILAGAAVGVGLGVAVVAATKYLRTPKSEAAPPVQSPSPSPAQPSGPPVRRPPARVRWQVTVAAARPGASARADALVAQALVDRGLRVITARGSAVTAISPSNEQLWSSSLPTGNVELRQWADGMLVADLRRLWLVDSESGRTVFDFDAGEHIERIAVCADRAFLSVRNATIALDRTGKVTWRIARPLTPLAADGTQLVTREPDGSATRLALRRTGTGASQWSVREDAALATPNLPPPPRLGEPVRDDSWDRVEARLGEEMLVLRNGQEVMARQLGSGRLAWHTRWPTPVAAIEPAEELLLVSADVLSAHDIHTGQKRWELSARGARIAVTPDCTTLVAATAETVSALDMAGRTRWQIPTPIQGAQIERVTADDRTAYLVHRFRDTADATITAIDLTSPS